MMYKQPKVIKKIIIYNFFQQKYVSLTSFGLNWFIIHHTFGTLTFDISSYFSLQISYLFSWQNNKQKAHNKENVFFIRKT